MRNERVGAAAEIDRHRVLRFRFDGRELTGHPGDTIASALLANGIRLIGRSFKYHRPRGILGAGVEEPNALVGVTRGPGRFEPNARATVVPLADGMIVESQNRRPSLSWDIGAASDLLSPFLPAGFYYKTFMWPRRFWADVYEPVIRRAAGLGRPPEVPDPDRYGMRYAHCQTLIVGGGPAGLAAALAASQKDGRVILVDDGAVLGGALRDDPDLRIDGDAAAAWVARTASLLIARGVRILSRTTAFGYGIDNFVGLAQRCDESGGSVRERQWQVRADNVVLAAGSIERPLVFPNNDRPGIMLASAARSYLHRQGVRVGRKVVVVACHDSGWRAAIDLARTGAAVTIVDARVAVAPDLIAAADAVGLGVDLGMIPLDTRGRHGVNAVAIGAAVDARPRWLKCDAVLIAGGWTPSVHLYSQSGGKVVWDETLGAFVPGPVHQPQISAGSCGGRVRLPDCLAEGWVAGGGEGPAPTAIDRMDEGASPAEPAVYRDGSRRKAFVDFQNDVTAKDIRLAVREGFRSVEHLKRYTTNGMATDQGRTSNITALAIAAQEQGIGIAEAGLTTFRAPFTPVTFGTMAGHARGDLSEPVRTTPMHDRAVAAGAVFEDVGQWKRARGFPRAGETLDDAVVRECNAVRTGVGVFDTSTLGKIEVVGPDAAEFLDRIYAGRLSTLAVGKCRYALLLGEDGFVMDDGITARIAPDRFHVTTTTGGLVNVLDLMEDFRQTEWPELKVWLASTTEEWATILVNGPRSRRLLRPLIQGIDLATEYFPHMSVAAGTLRDIPIRLMRASFTGEMGYEVNVPANHALVAWDMILNAGQQHGAMLYGTDASHVLRAEKGYIIIGQETDGTTTPRDVGLHKMVASKKADFLGKRSLMRPTMDDPDRRQLVGIFPAKDGTIDEGMQVVDPARPTTSLGHVSSAYFSGAMGQWFGLAMIRGGRQLIGERLALALDDGTSEVTVVDPVFYDAAGARLDA